MIKIGKSYINENDICYVSIKPYPGTKQPYIPKVVIRDVKSTKIFDSKPRINKRRFCADCGDELDEEDKYCLDCYDDGEGSGNEYLIYINWNHAEMGFTEEELTKEEYDRAIKQLDSILR